MPTEPDAPGNEPNLELPNLRLGLGRRKKRGDKSPSESTAESAADTAVEDGTAVPSGAAVDPAADAGPTPPLHASPRAPAAPPVPPRDAEVATPPRPPARPPARPAARPPSRPAAATPPAPEPVAPQQHPEHPTSAAEDTAVLDPSTLTYGQDTTSDPLSEAATSMESSAARPSRRTSRSESRARRRAQQDRRERPSGAEARLAIVPRIKPSYAAFLTGILAGLAAVGLAIGASRGCEAVRDTSSCGGGLGLLALVGILAIEVFLGATLLKAWKITDPYSTSFLGVALVAIIAMLVFLDELNSLWMLLVIPALTAVAFVLSCWLTERIINEQPVETTPQDLTDDNADRDLVE